MLTAIPNDCNCFWALNIVPGIVTVLLSHHVLRRRCQLTWKVQIGWSTIADGMWGACVKCFSGVLWFATRMIIVCHLPFAATHRPHSNESSVFARTLNKHLDGIHQSAILVCFEMHKQTQTSINSVIWFESCAQSASRTFTAKSETSRLILEFR